MAVRVRIQGWILSVEHGGWSGPKDLAALAKAADDEERDLVGPIHGSPSDPDPDFTSAMNAAGALGGKVLDEQTPGTDDFPGRVY